jgi:hypothetical protein
MLLEIAKIRTDGGTQARASVPEATLEEYVQALIAKAVFPPVVVFYDGEYYWLADGFIRREAHVRNGRTEIEADVRPGTLRDAILYAAGANAEHGLSRTNEDKRRAVEMLLADEEWASRSNRWVAEAARVSHHLVASMRPSLPGGNSPTRTDRRGHNQPASKPKAEPPADGSEPGREAVDSGQVREPGDDTDAIEKERVEEKAKPKNGSPLVDWKDCQRRIDSAVRVPDDVARAYGMELQEAEEFKLCMDGFSKAVDGFEALKKRLTRSNNVE